MKTLIVNMFDSLFGIKKKNATSDVTEVPTTDKKEYKVFYIYPI